MSRPYEEEIMEAREGIGTPTCELYGFKMRAKAVRHTSKVEYLGDNKDFARARMNFREDVFDFGSWVGSYFIQNCKPVMLGFDGTVKEYLDPDNYSQTIEGRPSRYSEMGFQGNAMTQIPLTYLCLYREREFIYVWVSNEKLTPKFTAYAHQDSVGQTIPYLYYPMYHGTLYNLKIRSLSGCMPSSDLSYRYHLAYCNANNPEQLTTLKTPIWWMETYSTRNLIFILLILLTGTTNLEEVLGRPFPIGLVGKNSESQMVTGSYPDIDKKGMFWGMNTSSKAEQYYPQKVFHIENFFGGPWRFIQGIKLDQQRHLYIKPSYYLEDPPTMAGYGDGTSTDNYIETDITYPYVQGVGINEFTVRYNMLIPLPKIISIDPEYQLQMWTGQLLSVALAGGKSFNGYPFGGPGIDFNAAALTHHWSYNSAPECHPLLITPPIAL